jgi:hypothetical protein
MKKDARLKRGATDRSEAGSKISQMNTLETQIPETQILETQILETKA